MWMFNTSIHLSTSLPLLLMNIVSCVAACNNAEYEISGQCCPMCDPGERVYIHCNETTTTTCSSCLENTYADVPNGLKICQTCELCDAGNGLRVKQECTRTSNTVCKPLSGHYCIDPQQKSCLKAKKHSTCSPGQYMNQIGTEFTDTVCGDCPAGSYSDGTICKFHTRCESLGKITIEPGTETTDAKCSDEARNLLLTVISSVCASVFLLLFITVVVIVKKRKNAYYRPNHEIPE